MDQSGQPTDPVATGGCRVSITGQPCQHAEWEINPPEPDRGITQRWASCVDCGQWTADLEVDWEVEVDEDGFPVVTGSVLIPRWPEEPA